MEAPQTVQQRAQDAARQVLREVIDELPAPTKLENETVWLEGLENWMTDFDRETRLKHYPAHKLVELARHWAAEYYEDCFRQSYHQLEDAVAWQFELSLGLLIMKGYFRSAEGGDVEMFHSGHYLALKSGANALMWQQNTLVPPRQPQFIQVAPTPTPTSSNQQPAMRLQTVIMAVSITIVVIVTLYLFG